MKKLYNISLVLLTCFLLVACSKPTITSKESIGKIVDANIVPTSFNESIKTQVKCERRYLVVYSTLNCPIGVEAYIVTFSDGRSYLTWENNNGYMWPCSR